MAFKFSQRSLTVLATVHPDLQRVAHLALEKTAIDFTVIQGLRTRDQQAKLFGQGRTAQQMRAQGLPIHYAQPNAPKVTWTMNSNHMSGKALDFAPYVKGIILPARPTAAEIDLFRRVSIAFKGAAKELCLPLTWGGDWQKNKDFPHIELVSK